MRFILSMLMLVCCATATQAENHWLFVTLLREQKIVSFRRDAESGKLLRKAETKCEAEPGVMAISPDRNTLFVALRSSGQIASYRLDAESGELELINTVEGATTPRTSPSIVLVASCSRPTTWQIKSPSTRLTRRARLAKNPCRQLLPRKTPTPSNWMRRTVSPGCLTPAETELINSCLISRPAG